MLMAPPRSTVRGGVRFVAVTAAFGFVMLVAVPVVVLGYLFALAAGFDD